MVNLLIGIGIDEYLIWADGVGVRNYFTDGFGSSIGLVDALCIIQIEYIYELFGFASTSGASTDNIFGFMGCEIDGIGFL